MPYLKKVIFSLPFLLFFFLFCLNLDAFLQNYNFLFSLDFKELFQVFLMVLYLILSSAFFTILVTLSLDWKIILPAAILASLIPLSFITSSAYLLIFGFFLSFLFTYLFLQKKLQNYLTFQASSLLMPSVKSLTTLIILVSSLVFYLNISQDLGENGFLVPDSLLDPIINITTSNLPTTDLSQDPGIQFNFSQDQINLLKQNPELLKQYGLDPKILDQVGAKPTDISQNYLIKSAVNSQIQNLIGPNIEIIAIVLAVAFFVSLNFLASFLAIFIYPVISGVFWILEKVGFTKFEIEKRDVKKLVV